MPPLSTVLLRCVLQTGKRASIWSQPCIFPRQPRLHTFAKAVPVTTTIRRSTWTLRGGLALSACAVAVALVTNQQQEIYLDAPHSDAEHTRVDPDTGIAFPEALVIPSKARLPHFTLLGLGVRRVSFIGLKVYSVGFYADLSNPNLRIPKDITPDERVKYLISNTACAIRIIPTRSTNYTHLRDSFVRSLQSRLSSALKSGTIATSEAEEAQSPLRKFKSLFPNSSLTKGTPLDIVLTEPPKNSSAKRVLIVRDLGVIENDWIARELFLAYFDGDGISPPMKKSVLAAVAEA